MTELTVTTERNINKHVLIELEVDEQTLYSLEQAAVVKGMTVEEFVEYAAKEKCRGILGGNLV